MPFMSEFAFYIVLLFEAGTFVCVLFDVRWTVRSQKMLYVIFGIFMMLMAYSIWPGKGSDLSRYCKFLKKMNRMNFSEALKYGYYSTTPITNVFMWLISKTGNNKLLPCISTGIILLNTYILMGTGKSSGGKSKSYNGLYLILIYSVATLLAITTGVRQNWMVSVYSLAVFREYVKEKKDIWTILLYIAACMIHTSAVMLVAVRFCSMIKGKKKALLLSWILIAPWFERLAFFQGLLGEAVDKFYGYQKMGNEGLDMRYLVARLGVLTVLAVMCWKVRKNEKKSGYINFYSTLIIITFGSISVAHLFSRMVNAVVYTSLPLLNEYYESATMKETGYSKLCLAFLSFGLFVYHFVLIRNSVSFI